MSSKIINISMRENIIDFTCGYYAKSGGKKTAFISGGKRQFLFIKKKLAQAAGTSFVSPAFFTNDDFIENAVFDNTDFVKIPDIEAAFMIYEAVQDVAPELLKGKKSFAGFLQWALEIASFIEQLDLEKVSGEKLKNITANADIGYDVPENINDLLKNMFKIKDSFHSSLEKASKTTKGYSFLKVSGMDFAQLAGEYEEFILLAPFYLHKTELEIFKKIFDAGKLTVITQGDPENYDSLNKIYSYFGSAIEKSAKSGDAIRTVHSENARSEKPFDADLNIYGAYDDQSQAVLLKNLIAKMPEAEYDKTVIIVPEAKLLQPVMSEISAVTDNYNVSAGYPASKTAVFTLLRSVTAAQLSRKNENYYVKDLIKTLSNPLVKNMRFFGDPSLTRIIAHKLKQAFDRDSKTSLSGKIFVSFEEIYNASAVLESISKSSAGASGYINADKLKNVLSDIFETLFCAWEKPETLNAFAEELHSFAEKLCELSIVSTYPLNSEAIEIILSLSRQMKYGKVARARFAQNDILNIFSDLLEDKKIPLPGSPLKGLQVLGLLESRNISFENVFIVGMTDSAMPAVKKESPLVPKDIMFALGIEMAKKEYEIQNYHFNRLISQAKKISLIYPDNEKEERSRFIERLVWDRQLKSGSLDCAKTKKIAFPSLKISNSGKKRYEKSDKIKRYLKKMKYSYSKIDTYLRCRLEFYFRYVLGLDEASEIGAELSGSEMGSFIHDFLRSVFYEGMESSGLKKSGFKEHFFHELEKFFENCFELKFREDAFLIKKVLEHRMGKVLKFEREREFDGIYCCEKRYAAILKTDKTDYNVECIIDRADKKGGGYIILDYKTGSVSTPLVSKKFGELISSGLNRENIKKAVKSLQLPLYKYIFEQSEKADVCGCGVYDIKKAEIHDFFSNCVDAQRIYDGCKDIIKFVLDEISEGDYFEFDKKDGGNCKNCRFFYICRQ
ncbi:MAG: PD-(D/E)XK nuclease family protein [Endomicrobia bacterium]|nr:PD-(D/E)XK nuclease family protein [Endomicrobiia bacterium]